MPCAEEKGYVRKNSVRIRLIFSSQFRREMRDVNMFWRRKGMIMSAGSDRIYCARIVGHFRGKNS